MDPKPCCPVCYCYDWEILGRKLYRRGHTAQEYDTRFSSVFGPKTRMRSSSVPRYADAAGLLDTCLAPQLRIWSASIDILVRIRQHEEKAQWLRRATTPDRWSFTIV